jgi:hypothetical protein
VEGFCEHENEPSDSIKELGISSVATQLAVPRKGAASWSE